MTAYSSSYWRNAAAPVIARVIASMPGAGESAVRLALREAYPWGARAHHPYKIWLDECAVQLGKKPPAGKRAPVAKAKREAAARDDTMEDLFR